MGVEPVQSNPEIPKKVFAVCGLFTYSGHDVFKDVSPSAENNNNMLFSNL